MTTTFNLRASNNATFRWTRDLSQFAAVYNLAAATIRMQARVTASAPDPPAYEWVSTNSAHGQIIYDAATHLAVFAAPVEDAGSLAGDLVYDCRLEFSGGASVAIFGGRLRFAEGVTRLSGDLSGVGVSGLGDTVFVEGERGTSPVPLPLSLSAAVAACQTAEGAISAIAPGALAGLVGLLTAGGASSPLALALLALVPELPTAPASGVSTLWSDGGAVVVSQG